jgi:hypothetical protein
VPGIIFVRLLLRGRDVRIRQHPFDRPGIDFYYKILDSNEIEA